MSSLEREGNRIPVGGAVSTTDLTTPTPLTVDPVTGGLEIQVFTSTSSGSILPPEVGHDGNRRTTSYGVGANVPKALIIDHTNGYLFVDIGI